MPTFPQILIALLLLEIILLFFFSKNLIKSLGTLIISLTKSKNVTVYILAILFLPGTIIHELSHFFMALLLFVRVGKISVLPKVEEDEIHLGTCEIGKTDIARKILIGLAPMIVGFAIIIGLLWFFNNGSFNDSPLWQKGLLFYAIFEIANTMFSSKKDMEGALVFFLTILLLGVLIIGGLSMAGVSLSLNIKLSPQIVDLIKTVDIFLLVPLAINFIAFISTRFVNNRLYQ